MRNPIDEQRDGNDLRGRGIVEEDVEEVVKAGRRKEGGTY